MTDGIQVLQNAHTCATSSTSQGHASVPNTPECKTQHRNSESEEASTQFAKKHKMVH